MNIINLIKQLYVEYKASNATAYIAYHPEHGVPIGIFNTKDEPDYASRVRSIKRMGIKGNVNSYNIATLLGITHPIPSFTTGDGSYPPTKPFRILIETEGEVRYSWGTPNFIFEGDTKSATEIVTIINSSAFQHMLPHEYENAPYDLASTGITTFGHNDNVWLSCTVANGVNDSVVFVHEHTQDALDPLLRVKFYGSFVCQKLGFATDTWHYVSGFNLSTTDENQSVFTGHVLADELSIRNRAYIHAGARWSGNITFDVSGSEEIDHGMCWVTGSDKRGYVGWDPFASGSVCWVTEFVSASIIRSSGDVIALYTSDKKLKDNIEYILDPVSKVKQLNGIEFEWNASQSIYPVGTKDVGIIAQDLQKVYPELVATSSNGYLGVKHDRLVALLIEAVKEQSNEIDNLKQRISNLENFNG